MDGLVRAVVGLLLLAHGLVHRLYVTPSEDPKFPFTLDSSWLVPASVRRPVGLSLMIATVVAFGVLTLAVWGTPGLAGAWPGIAMAAALLSLVTLVAFWNRQLVFGVAIDLAVVVLAITRPDWVDRVVG
jgi:hypothetical protein